MVLLYLGRERLNFKFEDLFDEVLGEAEEVNVPVMDSGVAADDGP